MDSTTLLKEDKPVEQVDVYYLNGTKKEDSNVTSMITPRGLLSSILVDNRFVVAAGGLTSIDSNPVSLIEVLDTLTGQWSSLGLCTCRLTVAILSLVCLELAALSQYVLGSRQSQS